MFQTFAADGADDEIAQRLERIRRRVKKEGLHPSPQTQAELSQILQFLMDGLLASRDLSGGHEHDWGSYLDGDGESGHET